MSRSASKLCDLAAERVAPRRSMSTSPRWSRSRTIIPAHVPKIGPLERRAAPRRARRGASAASIAVDSPPGMTSPSSPSSCSGSRTSTGSAPSRRSTAACSRKLPCTARTPISQLVHARIVDGGYSGASGDGRGRRRRASPEPEAEQHEPGSRPRPARAPAPRLTLRGRRAADEARSSTRAHLLDEVDRSRRRSRRAEHRPARALRRVRDRDVDEARRRRSSAQPESLECHQ